MILAVLLGLHAAGRVCVGAPPLGISRAGAWCPRAGGIARRPTVKVEQAFDGRERVRAGRCCRWRPAHARERGVLRQQRGGKGRHARPGRRRLVI